MIAALKFIEIMCECGLPVRGGVEEGKGKASELEEEDDVLSVWQTIVDENLAHTEETLRVSLPSVSHTHQTLCFILTLGECSVSIDRLVQCSLLH